MKKLTILLTFCILLAASTASALWVIDLDYEIDPSQQYILVYYNSLDDAVIVPVSAAADEMNPFSTATKMTSWLNAYPRTLPERVSGFFIFKNDKFIKKKLPVKWYPHKSDYKAMDIDKGDAI